MKPIMFTVEASYGDKKHNYQSFDFNKALRAFEQAIVIVGNKGTVKLTNGTTWETTTWDKGELYGNCMTVSTVKEALK